MASQEIDDFNALTTPARGDLAVLVDVSDTADSPQGTTKKIAHSDFMRLAAATKTTDYTTTDDDHILFLDSPTAKTLSLIDGASRGVGRPYYVKNVNSGVWTIDPNGSENIDGATTLDMAERDKFAIHWTGTAWETI